MATTIKQNVSKINYELRRGDTFDPSLTYRDSANAVIDLTTYTARLEIRSAIDGTVILALSEISGITLAATSPNISILILPAVTAAFTFDVAVYDLELIDNLGVVKTLIEGTIALKKDVTI